MMRLMYGIFIVGFMWSSLQCVDVSDVVALIESQVTDEELEKSDAQQALMALYLVADDQDEVKETYKKAGGDLQTFEQRVSTLKQELAPAGPPAAPEGVDQRFQQVVKTVKNADNINSATADALKYLFGEEPSDDFVKKLPDDAKNAYSDMPGAKITDATNVRVEISQSS